MSALPDIPTRYLNSLTVCTPEQREVLLPQLGQVQPAFGDVIWYLPRHLPDELWVGRVLKTTSEGVIAFYHDRDVLMFSPGGQRYFLNAQFLAPLREVAPYTALSESLLTEHQKVAARYVRNPLW